MKHKLLIAFTFSLGISLTGCFPESATSDGGKQLYETAKMEELQEADKKARKMYEEIIEKYPETEYARMAKTRLATMDEQE